MRSIGMKFIAILLAALSLFAVVGSVLGIVLVSALEKDSADVEQAWKQGLEDYARDFAWQEAGNWASLTTSTAPQEAVEALAIRYIPSGNDEWTQASLGLYSYTIYLNGKVVSSGGTDAPADAKCWSYNFTDVTPTYTQVHPSQIGTQVLGGTFLHAESYDGLVYHLFSCQDLVFQADVVLYHTGELTAWTVLEKAWQARDLLPVLQASSALLLAVSLVYLCWAAGKKKGREEIRPGGLNRLPLDLYVVADCFLGYFGLQILFEGVRALFYDALPRLAVIVAVADVFAMCLVIVGFVFCFAAQVKVKGFWWRHSVIGFCLLMIFRGIRFCVRGVRAIFRLLPVIWQWLLTAALMVLAAAITGAFAFFDNSYIRVDEGACFLFFLTGLICVGVVLYGGYCFGTILKGAKEMAKGNLDHKVSTRYLLGAFKDCGENLNSLSSAAMVAAQQQMKSERMKTELITNVSHDIKTPLTSIINYVDLLQQPHSEEEGAQYLEVLARQSQRLKKLTEDLVEMSKAATGNVVVDIGEVDASEAVLQALGEFGDKLDSVPLSIVFRQPEEPVYIRADGRLTWRVMSNLLSNAVKYAQPGTRLYVEVLRCEGQVRVSFKNISREQLNVAADELMERFVRGDASRNTEGSGLGLNIARSLMQVQQGDLQLFVDGDLFKVTLTFPGA